MRPANPCSSAQTEKMKSVCCSGRKESSVWVPCPQPFPSPCPDPTAIIDCVAWYPAPSTSPSGSRKVSTRFRW